MSYSISYILSYDSGNANPQVAYLSQDKGVTWTLQGTIPGTVPRIMFTILADPNRPGYVFAAGDSGIRYSTDYGVNWDLSGGTYYVTGWYQKIRTLDSTVFYAGGNKLVKSQDGGLTFTDIIDASSIYPNPSTTPRFYAIALLSNTSLYASIDDKLFKSTNSGASWTPLNGDVALSAGSNIQDIYTNTTGNIVVVGTGDKIYYSNNGGTSFITVLTYSYSDSAVTFSKSPDGTLLYAFISNYSIVGNDQVYVSINNGLTWVLKTTSPFSANGEGGYLASSYFYDNEVGISVVRGGGNYTNDEGETLTTISIGAKPLAVSGSLFPSYRLYDCVNPEVYIDTNTDLSLFVNPSKTVRLIEYPGQCWQVGAYDGYVTEYEEVTVDGDPYSSCEECIPVYYILTNCETEDILYTEPSDELLANNGLVVNIQEQEGCWSVERFQEFTEEILISVTVTQGNYADCSCCIPTPAPEPIVFTRTTQQPVKQFYRVIDSECEIRTNTKFAENYYRLFQGLKYGIKNCCGDVNFDKLWVEKELLDYSLINDPESCTVTIVAEITPECDASPIAICAIPEDVSGEGDFS